MNLIGRFLRWQEWDNALLYFKANNNRVSRDTGWQLWDRVMERFNAYRAMCTEGMDGI